MLHECYRPEVRAGLKFSDNGSVFKNRHSKPSQRSLPRKVKNCWCRPENVLGIVCQLLCISEKGSAHHISGVTHIQKYAQDQFHINPVINRNKCIWRAASKLWHCGQKLHVLPAINTCFGSYIMTHQQSNACKHDGTPPTNKFSMAPSYRKRFLTPNTLFFSTGYLSSKL